MNTSDIIVVGGGVIGTATAYYLSKTGAKVTLIDRQDVASGTSSRCDGNIVIYDMMPEHVLFARTAQDLFPGVADELGYNIEWKRRGSVLYFDTEEEIDHAKRHVAAMVEKGQPYKYMDYKDVIADEPMAGPKIKGGVEIGCDGSLNPMFLAFGLMEGARRNGCRFVSNSPVIGIYRNEKGAVTGVKTERGDYHAPIVVDAAGPWSAQIAAMVDIHIKVEPRQGQLIVSERTGRVAKRKISEFSYITTKVLSDEYKRPVSREMEEHGICFVFEPCEAGNFLIGSSRWFNGFDTRSNSLILKLMAQRAIDYFPCLKDMRAIRSYSGLRPYSPDHYPIVSGTDVPGFYIATGHEGSGILYSLMTGILMSQIVTKAKETIIDPARWDFARFSQPQQGH